MLMMSLVLLQLLHVLRSSNLPQTFYHSLPVSLNLLMSFQFLSASNSATSIGKVHYRFLMHCLPQLVLFSLNLQRYPATISMQVI